MWFVLRFKSYMRRYYSKSRSSDKVMVVTSEAEAEHVMQQIEKDAAMGVMKSVLWQ